MGTPDVQHTYSNPNPTPSLPWAPKCLVYTYVLSGFYEMVSRNLFFLAKALSAPGTETADASRQSRSTLSPLHMGNSSSQKAQPAAAAPRQAAPQQPAQSSTVSAIQKMRGTINTMEKRINFLEKKQQNELKSAMAEKKAGNKSGEWWLRVPWVRGS